MELGVRKLRFGEKKIFEGRQKHIFKAFFFFMYQIHQHNYVSSE